MNLYPVNQLTDSRKMTTDSKADKLVPLKQSILHAAALLFVEKGFEGTSVNDIASALAVTRTSVYYYFKNKDEILKSLTLDISLLARELTTNVVLKADRDPTSALKELVRVYTEFILSDPLLFRVSERNENNLSEKDRKDSMNARRTVLENFRQVIQSGIVSGHFRAVDPNVAAFAIIGMCNWSAWWFQSSGRHDQIHVSDMLVEMAFHSLGEPDGLVRARSDPQQIIKTLRSELERLESIVVAKGQADKPEKSAHVPSRPSVANKKIKTPRAPTT